MKISLTVNKEFLINFSTLIGNIQRRTAFIKYKLKLEEFDVKFQENLDDGNKCLEMLNEFEKLENFNLSIGE